jgi:hypothetical protein
VVAASFTSSLSGVALRAAFGALGEDARLAHVPPHQERDEAGEQANREHAAPADVREQPRRDERRQQHAGLPADADVGAGARPQPRRPRLGDQRHADAELAAQAEAGDGAIDDEVPVALRQRAQAGEHREDEDRPGQHGDAAVIVAERAEHDAAHHRPDQRPRRQRAADGGAQPEVGADRGEHESEDEEVEAVHGIPDHRGGERLLGFRVGLLERRSAAPGFECNGHEPPFPSAGSQYVRQPVFQTALPLTTDF